MSYIMRGSGDGKEEIVSWNLELFFCVWDVYLIFFQNYEMRFSK